MGLFCYCRMCQFFRRLDIQNYHSKGAGRGGMCPPIEPPGKTHRHHFMRSTKPGTKAKQRNNKIHCYEIPHDMTIDNSKYQNIQIAFTIMQYSAKGHRITNRQKQTRLLTSVCGVASFRELLTDPCDIWLFGIRQTVARQVFTLVWKFACFVLCVYVSFRCFKLIIFVSIFAWLLVCFSSLFCLIFGYS